MAIIKKFSSYQNLSNYNVLVPDIVPDINPNSSYFRITEFKETFTGGKNAFLIEGSPFLKETTEVKIEILDVDGNPVYYEPGDGIPEYYEGLSKVVSVLIYPDTPIGLGKITILGEAKEYIDGSGVRREVPDEWKGAYNVKWERTFQINRNLQNETIVRFYKRPQVQITEIVKPIFNKTIPTKTVSGSVSGEPIQPGAGTNLSTWRAGTLYRLTLSSGSWDNDIDENPINISVNGNSFNPTIIEVLNNTQVLVDVPYTENSLVQPFTSQSFTASFLDFENEIPGESALTGSFGKIDLTQLKTFAGDVARVKVYRRSRNEVGDFQFVQESRLESTELLRDIFVSDAVEIPYGNFSDSTLNQYWESSSIDHPITVDSSVLSQAVKVDYNGSEVQRLFTSQSFNISKDVEYELSFKTLLSGSTTSDKYLRAYLTGSFVNSNSQVSQFEQNFVFISGSDVFSTRQNVSQNILAERDVTASLAFEFVGDDWYLSQVSLKNAQETSFSPDEFTLVQSIPRKLEKETFDFRFEFYDINNNYIPVDVNATKEFDGGNDYVIGGTSARILTFESDRNAFRYASGSASPNNQTILLQVTKTNLTGSINYTSGAFDEGGNFLTSSGWSQYPGLLTNRTDSPSGGSSTLTVANFSGSWTGSGTQPEVYSIVYTASVEDLQEFETVFRVEDGDNAPQLLVTSNANQFIYEPTTLSPKPSGQSITIRAQRKNLESLNSTITVTKDNPDGPDLVEVVGGDNGGVKTYTLSASDFRDAFLANDFDEVTYNFSSNDVFGVAQTDQITISKVINFDGISLVLSNESVTFPANSTGAVIGGFDASSGSVQMFIGGNQIQHIDGLFGQKNAFDIISASGQNVVPTDATPSTSNYSISDMTADSGSLTLDIRYIAGDSSTSQSFQKAVTYTKAKKAAPNIEFQITPTSQTIEANSLGSGSAQPRFLTVTAREGDTPKSVTINPTPLSITGGLTGSVTTNNFNFTSNASSMSTDTGTVILQVFAENSEGTYITGSVSSTVSRVRKAVPRTLITLTPQTQTITSSSLGGIDESNLQLINISISSGSVITDSTPSVGTKINNTTIDLSGTVTDSSGVVGSVDVEYTDEDGRTGLTQTLSYSVAVAVQGENGASGSDGEDGEPGIAGPGLTYVGECSFLPSGWTWVNDEDSRQVTSVSGTYYVTLPAANGVTKTTTGCPPNVTYFEALESFASVATDILLAQDATITRTLTIGTFDTDLGIIRSANAIDFTTGDGMWLDNNGDVRFGSPTGNFVEWDQSAGTLTIKGDLNLDSSGASDGGFATSGIFLDNSGWISAENFYIDSSGNAKFKGDITGATGTFNGKITAGTIQIGNNVSDTDDGIYINADNYWLLSGTDATFKVGNDTNNLIWDGTDLTLTGNIENDAVLIDDTNVNIKNDDGSLNFIDATGNVRSYIQGETFSNTGDLNIYAERELVLTADGRVDIGVNGDEPDISVYGDVFFSTVGSGGYGIIATNNTGLESLTIGGPAVGSISGVMTMISSAGSNYVFTAGTGLGIDLDGKVFSISNSLGATIAGQLDVDGGYSGGSGATIDSDGDMGLSGNLVVDGDITAGGNITAFFSDDRLKTRIKNITEPLIKIKKINGFEYELNETSKKLGFNIEGVQVGVSAQEVEKILPQVVKDAPFDTIEDKGGNKVSKTGKNYKTVQYDKLIPLLIEGIKELSQKVEDLENEIFKLKGQK